MRTSRIAHLSAALSVGAVLLAAPAGWAVEQSETPTDHDTAADTATGTAPAADEYPTPPSMSPEQFDAAARTRPEDPRLADIDQQVKEGVLSPEDAQQQKRQIIQEDGLPVPEDAAAKLGGAAQETTRAEATDEAVPSEENPDEIGAESADESEELSAGPTRAPVEHASGVR